MKTGTGDTGGSFVCRFCGFTDTMWPYACIGWCPARNRAVRVAADITFSYENRNVIRNVLSDRRWPADTRSVVSCRPFVPFHVR